MRVKMFMGIRHGWAALMLVAFAGLFLFSSTAQSITREEAELIIDGNRIFNEETFEGNGRVCATCHVPDQHYTIGPEYIRNEHGEERRLIFVPDVLGLENETLVRELAVFNGGPGDATVEFPVGPFRAAAQITALDCTTLSSVFGPPTFKLGWDGSGQPNGGFHHGNVDENADGTVRAFCNGAIAQHACLTLARIAKTTACPDLDIDDPDAHCGAPYDFRFASNYELDALEAFMRWLGRRPAPGTPAADDPANLGGKGEFTLVKIPDTGDIRGWPFGPSAEHELIFSNAIIEKGKHIFNSFEGSCFLCHQNGGAHIGNNGVSAGNITRGQGADEYRFALSERTGINIPMDPGDPLPSQEQAMNIQTIIEAPRLTDYHHNHPIQGFENQVREGFKKPFVRDLNTAMHCVGLEGTGSPGREGLQGPSRDIHSDTVACLEEVHGANAVNNLAGFIRELSAWYGLRDAERLIQETCELIDLGVSTDLWVEHGGFVLDDVSSVLRGSKVHPRPHANMIGQAQKLKAHLIKAVKNEDKDRLREIHATIQNMRDQIATTTEEGERVECCQ